MSGDITSIDFFSLFATTICAETPDHRETTCLLGELLVEFKDITDSVPSSRNQPSAPPHSPTQQASSSSTRRADHHSPHDQHPERMNPQRAPTARPSATEHTLSDSLPPTASEQPHRAVPPVPNTTPTENSPHRSRTEDSEDDRDDSPGREDGAIAMIVDIKSNRRVWHVVPDSILNSTVLPSWFPSSPFSTTLYFRSSILHVEIDRFRHLNWEKAAFVYSGLIRTSFKKAVQLYRSRNNRPKSLQVFSFQPFTPPWFSGLLRCTVHGNSVYDDPIRIEETTIPRKRDFRSRSSSTVTML